MTTRPSTPPRARSSRRSPARALGSSGRCRCRRRRTSTASSARRTSTRTRGSTSRCAPTSGSSTSSTRRPRRSTRSCASTCRRRSTSTSSKADETMTTVQNSKPARQVTGILGTKLGMTQVFDENNRVVPVTVVQAGPNVVTQVRTPEKDGYTAVQLAFGAVDPRKVNKPRTGHFAKAGTTPRRHVVELRTSDAAEYSVGQEITATVFEPGSIVDVVGTSKGKGTAGVMKRHGFKGLGASHGTQRKHRSPGSIGACATPSRVFKGVRMAGRMGAVRQTTQNLTVHAVDAERGLLLIKGAVPGPRGSVVLVKTAAKGA